jgi:hypothetical protein
MAPASRTALLMSVMFFVAAADHTAACATGASSVLYPFALPAAAQTALAVFDFGMAAAMYTLHRRWVRAR